MGISSYDMLEETVLDLVRDGDELAAIDKLEALNDAGNMDARTILGVFYLIGIGFIPDTEMGFQMIEEASAAGNANADEKLGTSFFNGEFGLEQDRVKAHFYFERAAAAGLPEAMGDCARDCFNGSGVAQDDRKALEWATRGAKLGDHFSMVLCGDAYRRGLGTAPNLSYAVGYYREALKIKPDDPTTKNDMATCLLNLFEEPGVTVSQNDIEEGIRLLFELVEEGDETAHCSLGMAYALGVGVEKDDDLAHHYIQLAADNGYEPAVELLGCFRMTMRGTWSTS